VGNSTILVGFGKKRKKSVDKSFIIPHSYQR